MELIENIHIWNDPKISCWGSLPPPSIFGFPMLSEIHPHLQGLLDGFHLAIYMQKVVVHPGEFRFKKRSSTYTIPNKHDGILRQISPFKGWQVTSCDGFFAPIFFFRIYTVAWCTKQRIMTIQSLSSLSLRGDQPNGWNIWNLRYFKVGKTSMTSLNLTFLGYLGPVIEVRLWKSSRSFIYNYQGLQGSILDQKLGVLFQPKKKLSLHLPLFLFSGKNILHPISHKMS